MHARFAPATHRFLYRIFLFAIDLDELAGLHAKLRLFSLNRRNVYSFRENDFLPTQNPVSSGSLGLKQRVLDFLATRGQPLPANSRVLLVSLPRVAGYLFNPVSFYFCFNPDGAPVAALAEVTNTFKEIKPYYLGPSTQFAPGDKTFQLRTPKHFYVSPFSDVDVAFDFTLRVPQDRLSIQIDDYEGANRTLTSTLTGQRQPLTDTRLAWYLLKYPFITLRIITLIHWHAFRLWLKNVPWFPKAARAADQRDLYRPHHSIAQAPRS